MKRLLVSCLLLTLPVVADPSRGKVLIVLSGTRTLELQDHKTVPTGYFLDELAVPAQELLDAGYEVVIATPDGDKPVMDEYSNDVKFFADEAAHQKALRFVQTYPGMQKPEKLRMVLRSGIQNFAGLYVPGGHAPLNDLMQDRYLGSALRHFHHYAKPTAFLCHGPVATLSALPKPEAYKQALILNDPALTSASIANWPYVGYRMTVFSTAEEQSFEERAGGKLPFYPQEALSTAGAAVEVGPPGKSFVVKDRELITGQNPASDHALAEALIAALEEKH